MINIEDYKQTRATDSVAEFVKWYLGWNIKLEGKPTATIYEEYNLFCDNRNFEPVSRAKFAHGVNRICGTKTTSVRFGKNTRRVFSK